MKRQIINAVLSISGGLTAVSGLFMLFHYESYFTKSVHELAAVVLLFFCFWHIKLNWRPLAAAFGNKTALYAGFGIFALCTALMLVLGSFDNQEREIRRIVQEKFGVELPNRQQ